MKKLAVALFAIGTILSGCIFHDEPPRRDRSGENRGDRDRDGVANRADRDRDGDGVRNRDDRRPNDPRRY
jgi:hypothetical protein